MFGQIRQRLRRNDHWRKKQRKKSAETSEPSYLPLPANHFLQTQDVAIDAFTMRQASDNKPSHALPLPRPNLKKT